MKKLMTFMAVGSLSATTLLGLGKFIVSTQTAVTVSQINESEKVEKAAIDAARDEMAALIIPGYYHCEGDIPTMTNISAVAPVTGKRTVKDHNLMVIGYVTPDATLVITNNCEE